MRTLTSPRRRVAALAGALCAISGSSSLLLSTHGHPALGFTALGLLAGVAVAVALVVRFACRTGGETR